MINPGCCTHMYTTRRYDLDGHTIWSANYCHETLTGDTGVAGYVFAQAVDTSRVYVGGSRQAKRTNTAFWSLVCYDIETGEQLWNLDPATNSTVAANGESGDIVDLRIDGSGNVCALLTGQDPSGGIRPYQSIVVISPAGSVVAVRQFSTTVLIGSAPTLLHFNQFDINENGDYHIVTGVADFPRGLDWTSPFTSPPVARQLSFVGNVQVSVCIKRCFGRDYIGAVSHGFGVGKSMQALPYLSSDFDVLVGSGAYVFDILGDASGSIYAVGEFAPIGTGPALAKYDNSGSLLWAKGSSATVFGSRYSVCLDQLGNVYTSGGSADSLSGATIDKRDPSGNWLWGHWHAGTGDSTLLRGSLIQADPNGGAMIVSGIITKNRKFDVSFVPNPWP